MTYKGHFTQNEKIMATSKDYSRSVIAASDELRYIYCEPCVDGGKQIEAEGFCVDCSEYLCGRCYKNHTRYKAFKHHVLQDKDKMPLDATKAGVKDVCVEKCSLHSTKVVEYFCRSCDTLGCNACITLNHRQCKNVDHIPSIVRDIEKSEEFKVFTNNLDEILDAVDERKKKLVTNTTATDEMKRKAKSVLIKQRDEIKKFYDQLQANMNQRIEDIDRNNKETLKAAASTCDTIYDDLESIKTNIDTKLKNGQKCELFISMKNAKPNKEKLDKEFEKVRNGSKIQSYTLVPSPQIKEDLPKTSAICRLLTPKYLSEMNIRTKSDTESPSIFGLAIVQNHFLAVTDYNNKSVKMIDTRSMSVKSEMKMKCTRVWYITSMNEDQLAVSIKSVIQEQIQFLSVSMDGSLTKGNLIAVGGRCYGLTYSRENLFVLGYEKVCIIDRHGKIQQTIPTNNSRSIAVSPDSETIYLTNPYENTVSSMSLDGKVKAIYRDLKSPDDVTVDNDGFLYVGGSGSIHQLTEDFNKVQVIEDVSGSEVTYSNTDKRLYVGWGDMLTVYQME